MRLLYLLAGIISFLAAILFTLPAEKALAWWGEEMGAEVRLLGPQGGIASGHAAGIVIDDVQLGETRWRLRFISLLKARVGFTIQTEVDRRPSQAVVEFGLGGTTHIHDLQADVAIRSILPLLARGLILPVDGYLQADIPYLRIRQQQLTEAEGQLLLSDAGWSLIRPPLALGSYGLLLTTEDDEVVASISDAQGAAADAQGAIRLDASGAYTVDLQLRAKAGADQRLRNLLQGLGSPDAQGWYRLVSKGQL